jgi:hypothetical protein
MPGFSPAIAWSFQVRTLPRKIWPMSWPSMRRRCTPSGSE